MGVQGLRKLIESSGCARQLDLTPPGEAAQASVNNSNKPRSSSSNFSPQQNDGDDVAQLHDDGGEGGEAPPLIVADHVFLDMNCLIHQAFSRSHTDPKTTIRCVLQTLTNLLTRCVHARRTLALCFDGPAPVAKLATQRQRRRKVAHLDVANNSNFSDLSITTGSTFMLQLEQHVSHFVNTEAARKGSPLSRTSNIAVSGTSVPGEGEAKIAAALARAAATSAKSENDSVVVVGNDIDLVLTCIGATSFHNIGVLNPQTMQVIDVGSFLARWVKVAEATSAGAKHKNNAASRAAAALSTAARKASAAGAKDDDNQEQEEDDEDAANNLLNDSIGTGNLGFVPFDHLPGARIDFIWLFMLNGNDFYDGLGDVALSLWKRYKMLKRQRPEFRLVSKTHQLIVPALQALFQVEQIGAGDGDEMGFKSKRNKGKNGKNGRGGEEELDGGDDDSDFDDEKPDKNGSGGRGGAMQQRLSPEQRQASIGLLYASLWSLIGTVSGFCPNFRFKPVDPKHLAEATYVTTASLRATVAKYEGQTISFKVPIKVMLGGGGGGKRARRHGRGAEEEEEDEDEEAEFLKQHNYGEEEMGDEDEADADFGDEDDADSYHHQQQRRPSSTAYKVQMQTHTLTAVGHQQTAATTITPSDPLAPLSPLMTYCALMPRVELLPAAVQQLLRRNATLLGKWQAGGGELPTVMRRIVQLLDMEQLTPAEKFLTQFGDPVDVKGGFYRGHPLHGVARKDAEGNRKYALDFFRFGYAGSSASSGATSAGIAPLVADDLVPGAAKINEQARRIAKLSVEHSKHAEEMKLREQQDQRRQTLRAQKSTAAAELQEIKTRLSRFKVKSAKKNKGEAAMAALRKKRDDLVQKIDKINQALGTSASVPKKKSAHETQAIQQKKDGKHLYWFDVFSKESRSKVVQ